MDNHSRQVESLNKTSVVCTSLTYNTIFHLYHDRREHDKYVTAVTSRHTSKTLLDSGTLEENFRSSKIVHKLNSKAFKIHAPIYVMSVQGGASSPNTFKNSILNKGPASITIGRRTA